MHTRSSIGTPACTRRLPKKDPHVYGKHSQKVVKLAKGQKVKLDPDTRLKTHDISILKTRL
jgi:hypothetical protein